MPSGSDTPKWTLIRYTNITSKYMGKEYRFYDNREEAEADYKRLDNAICFRPYHHTDDIQVISDMDRLERLLVDFGIKYTKMDFNRHNLFDNKAVTRITTKECEYWFETSSKKFLSNERA